MPKRVKRVKEKFICLETANKNVYKGFFVLLWYGIKKKR